jgi:hypothetical protein
MPRPPSDTPQIPYLLTNIRRVIKASKKSSHSGKLADAFEWAKGYLERTNVRTGNLITHHFEDRHGNVRVVYYLDVGPFKQTLLYDSFIDEFKFTEPFSYGLNLTKI